MRIKKGDTVLVISGDDKGKMGKVLKIFKEKNRAVVESVNFIKRHTRPSTKNPKGGILEKEGSIEILQPDALLFEMLFSVQGQL